MKEEYKTVKGYEGLYEVSNLGNVRSLNYRRTGKASLLSPGVNGDGYYNVALFKDGSAKTKTVHQLVAECFLNHTACGMKLVVNHINLNKLDNRVENLEIISQRKNANRKHLKSTSKYTGVSWFKRDSNWRAYIRLNGKYKHLGNYDCELEAAMAYQNELKKIT